MVANEYWNACKRLNHLFTDRSYILKSIDFKVLFSSDKTGSPFIHTNKPVFFVIFGCTQLFVCYLQLYQNPKKYYDKSKVRKLFIKSDLTFLILHVAVVIDMITE